MSNYFTEVTDVEQGESEITNLEAVRANMGRYLHALEYSKANIKKRIRQMHDRVFNGIPCNSFRKALFQLDLVQEANGQVEKSQLVGDLQSYDPFQNPKFKPIIALREKLMEFEYIE